MKGRHSKVAAKKDNEIGLGEELKEKVDKKEKTAKCKSCDEKASSVDELLAKISELEAKLQEKEDQHLRMAAEYDNFRRRSKEEREAVYTEAVADTFAELLPIIDNLERAALYDEGEKVKEGLAITAKSVQSVLSKLSIEPIGEIGETFDPNYHNAVLHGEDENLGEGEIVDVFQKGYKKGNKIIRFAMVKTVN